MDFLQKTFVQLSELVGSMTPGARFTAAASVALILLGTAWLSNQRADRADAYLMGRQSFSAGHLGKMEAAFDKAGLSDYQIEGDRVRVPHGKRSKYMAALVDAGAMPQDSGEYLRQAVNSGGFMVSGSRQQAQLKIALESELQLVISRMKGVNEAFVHIAEETSAGFPRTKTVTASVSIEPSGAAAVDDTTIAAIRSFVANAWGGLKPENVTVVKMNPSDTPSSTAPTAPATTDPAIIWLGENWRALGIGGLILAGLLMAWSTVRSVARPTGPEARPELSLPQSLLLANADSPPLSAGRAARAEREPAAPVETLREELAVAIRQDPRSAAGVLRTWIGNAS